MEDSQEEINEFEAVAMVAEKDPAFEPYVVTDPPCFEDPNNLMMMNDNLNSFPSVLLQGMSLIGLILKIVRGCAIVLN